MTTGALKKKRAKVAPPVDRPRPLSRFCINSLMRLDCGCSQRDDDPGFHARSFWQSPERGARPAITWRRTVAGEAGPGLRLGRVQGPERMRHRVFRAQEIARKISA